MAETTPNFYQLRGASLHITYASEGLPDRVTGLSDGTRHFVYQDAQQTLRFAGDQVRVVQCDLGHLVSVFILRTIDSGSTSFSLFVPRVVLFNDHPVPIQTYGVTTVHRFSIIVSQNVGQDDLYTVTYLSGIARRIVFRQPPK